MSRRRRIQAAEQWVDADGTWPPPAVQPKCEATADKRQFERVDVNRQAFAAEMSNFDAPGAFFECAIINVSRGGLGLCAQRLVHVGRRLLMEVPGNPGEKPRLFFGTVRQVRYVEGQGHILGIQFEKMPRTAGVEPLLAGRRRPL